MNDVIQINKVGKRFGRKEVLKDIEFSVPSGVVFALLGENGAGKSTLIRGLLGYHRFEEGSASVLGLNPAKKPLEVRKQVGYVSDAPALYPWMTVEEVGWFASGFYAEGYLGEYKRLIGEFQVPTATRIRDLSKGMRSKVALSLAMAFHPKLLILDEPTSGLDPMVRRQFLESMVDLAADGETVFLSSHQINEVERVADWIAILHQGKLLTAAPLEDLKREMSITNFSMHDPLLSLPEIIESDSALRIVRKGRTVQVVWRKTPEGLQGLLGQDSNLFDLQHVRPSLEDIYMSFTLPSELQITPDSKSLRLATIAS